MDRRRTVRRKLAMLLVLSFLLALGGAAGFADGEDVTKPVEAINSEQTVGSVTVEEVETGTIHWPIVIAQAEAGKSAEVTASGDVSGAAMTGQTVATTGTVADAAGKDASAAVLVSGDVTTEGLVGAGGFCAQAAVSFRTRLSAMPVQRRP